MSEHNSDSSSVPRIPATPNRRTVIAYWLQLVLQPIIAVAFVVAAAWGFGYLQRHHGWFDSSESSADENSGEAGNQYACSMLCVFVNAPGRCPVCGMELQKVELTGDPKDLYGLTIEPAARRLANITTVAALNLPVERELSAFGKLTLNESRQYTITSYVDGRVERLAVDFTGPRSKREKN